MRASRPYLSLALLTALFGSLLPALAGPVSAESRGTVVIHARVCPEGLGPDAQLYDDCHDNPAPTSFAFTINNRQPKNVDANGNVSFKRAIAGDQLVFITNYDESYEGIRAFCSNVTLDTGPNEAFVRMSETPDFWTRLGAGSRLVCDVYFIP